MRIMLVTGGAGFIGSNFIKYFLRRNKNYIIVNIDKQLYSAEMNRLSDLESSPRYHHIKGDVLSRDLCEYVLRKYKPSWIVNFCSEPQIPSAGKFQPSSESSFSSTFAMLDGAHSIWARSSIADKRFIQISTDDVYGLTNDEDNYFDEDTPLRPENPMSAVKAAADLLAMSYYRAYRLPVVILRSCNTYGPWQDSRCIVPSIIKNILNSKGLEDTKSPSSFCSKPSVSVISKSHNNIESSSTFCSRSSINAANENIAFRSPGAVREWIHVYDLCSAITRSLFFARPGDIYNIGSNECASNADLAMMLAKIANMPADELSSAVTKDKREDLGQIKLNSYRARNNLKWSNSYNLEDGLKETLLWYKEHSFSLT